MEALWGVEHIGGGTGKNGESGMMYSPIASAGGVIFPETILRSGEPRRNVFTVWPILYENPKGYSPRKILHINGTIM